MQEPEQDKIKEQNITDELKESYLDYAMSVIVARALPDVRDGLKPVQRRVLFVMHELGLTYQAKFRKCAKIAGDTSGNYHPHGETNVYGALVNLVQEFGIRYPLIKGQGNFGSIDGDDAAAMRYTEAKLMKISGELLRDIEKETVDWRPNYDDTRQEPIVFPTAVPNLLLNGTLGIAVGMATNIPPHNLGELIDATAYLIDNPKATIEELVEFVKGPDFPTGGVIFNKKDIIEAYSTGRGPITMRGVAEVMERQKSGKEAFNILISEIPYQVNKSTLIEKMAELVQTKKIDGIKDIRDESTKDIRIIIELKPGANPQRILNQLFKFTQMQKNFNVNMVALSGGGLQPQVMSLKDVLAEFIEHRKEVVVRRTEFDLKKAREREHILEGLSIALANIDKVIELIKKSKDRSDAKDNLMKKFKLTEIQAGAILDMRLSTLAALERQKIEDELKEIKKLIESLIALLKSPAKILTVIKKELSEVAQEFGDARKTKVFARGLGEFSEEDLIPKEETILTMSETGYIKRVEPDTFKTQNRGGKGLIGSNVSDEDFLTEILYANTHDNILFFTDQGRVFRTKVYDIPAGSRTAKGRPVHNFLEIPTDEKVNAVITYSEESKEQSNKFLVMATTDGVIKKTPLVEFNNVRRTGIVALKLNKGDSLHWVSLSDGKDEVIITTEQGQAIRFSEKDVRAMGRGAAGVRGIKLRKEDKVSSMRIISKEDDKKKKLLVVMSNGYGKQTPLAEYKVQGRGGSGIKTANITTKTGIIMDAHVICDEEEIIALSSKGQLIRTEIKSVRTAGRSTQGVRIMNLNKGDSLSSVICF